MSTGISGIEDGLAQHVDHAVRILVLGDASAGSSALRIVRSSSPTPSSRSWRRRASAARSVCQASVAHFTRTGNSRTPANTASLPSPLVVAARARVAVTSSWKRVEERLDLGDATGPSPPRSSATPRPSRSRSPCPGSRRPATTPSSSAHVHGELVAAERVVARGLAVRARRARGSSAAACCGRGSSSGRARGGRSRLTQPKHLDAPCAAPATSASRSSLVVVERRATRAPSRGRRSAPSAAARSGGRRGSRRPRGRGSCRGRAGGRRRCTNESTPAFSRARADRCGGPGSRRAARVAVGEQLALVRARRARGRCRASVVDRGAEADGAGDVRACPPRSAAGRRANVVFSKRHRLRSCRRRPATAASPRAARARAAEHADRRSGRRACGPRTRRSRSRAPARRPACAAPPARRRPARGTPRACASAAISRTGLHGAEHVRDVRDGDELRARREQRRELVEHELAARRRSAPRAARAPRSSHEHLPRHDVGVVLHRA